MKVFGGHGLFPSCGDQPRKEAASFQLCTTVQCSVVNFVAFHNDVSMIFFNIEMFFGSGEYFSCKYFVALPQ